jgi:stage IV sporulation protein FB
MRSLRLGRIFGFPLELHPSFFLLLLLVAVGGWGAGGLWLLGVVLASIVLHELGHALVARHLGVPIGGIALHFFGGAAKMLGSPRTPGDEIAIAAAGPAVSFFLAGLGLVAARLGLGSGALVAEVNLAVGLFNLLPALPMDGGRILRALLARRVGHYAGTRQAVAVARVLALALGALGVLGGHFTIAALAVMLWMLGTQELRLARAQAEAARRYDPALPLGSVVFYRRF